MAGVIKWMAITAAVVTGGAFVYAVTTAARRRLDRGLATAEQMADDAARVLESTQRTLADTQQAVRHLRRSVS
jgi:predicted DNA-binding protein (UPF0278 family)